MAVIRRLQQARAIFMLGWLAWLSCGGAVHAAALRPHLQGPLDRRSLAAGATIFNVNNYGAKAGGKSDNVQAFMKAWNAACKSSTPAILLIPAGTYMAGQVEFHGPCKASPITVQVDGTVLAQTDISEFPSAEWFTFEQINGLLVTGAGTFDGQGSSVWGYNDCANNAHCSLLPTSLKFTKVVNGVVRGIKSLNSKSFHYMIHNCIGFVAEDLTITAPGGSPNTDGIHISMSSKVNISNSVIGTGDDCVSIGQGATDVTITRVTCGPGHGISVGSLGKYANEADVKGVTVRNCTIKNTENGARIKTWLGSTPSQASAIRFQDIIMDNVSNPIIIDQKYWGSKSKKSQPSLVKLSDIQFSNIKGTSHSKVAVSLACSSALPCQSLTLQDIDLSYNGKTAQSSCENARLISLGLQNPKPCQLISPSWSHLHLH